MQGQQMFGALVRCLGVYFFFRAVWNALYAASHVLPIPLAAKLSFAEDSFTAAVDLALAVVAFWGAGFFVRLAYGEQAKAEAIPALFD